MTTAPTMADPINMALTDLGALIDEYDPKESDWQFRKTCIHTVLRDLNTRLSATTSARDVREALENIDRVLEHRPGTPGLSYDNPERLLESALAFAQFAKDALSNLDAAAPAAGGDEGKTCCCSWSCQELPNCCMKAPLQAPSHSDAVRAEWADFPEVIHDILGEAVIHAAAVIRKDDDVREAHRRLAAGVKEAIAALTAPAAKAGYDVRLHENAIDQLQTRATTATPEEIAADKTLIGHPAVSEADVGRIVEEHLDSHTFEKNDDGSIVIDRAGMILTMSEDMRLIQSAAQGGGTESEATGKRPIPSVSLSSQGEQERDTLGVTAGETAPFPSDPPSQEASAPPIAGGR